MPRALALLLVLAGCGPSVSQHDGQALFTALNCRSCHRVGTEGNLSAPDLTYVGFRKTPQWLDLWLKDPQAWKPGTTMPNPHLTDATRQAVVQYLSTLKGQGFAGAKPWDDPSVKNDPTLRGHVIFGRAGCIACHGKDGEGGNPNNNVPGGKIPALTTVSQTYTKAELLKKIKNGSKPAKADPNGPEPMIFMPPWGQVLSDDEIASVAAYVLSLKPSGAASPGF